VRAIARAARSTSSLAAAALARRGADPARTAGGDARPGSIMQMDAGLDTGDLLARLAMHADDDTQSH
jgi:methionyl-tRNA formyltransferase